MTTLNSFCFAKKIIGVLLVISIGQSHCQQTKPFFTSLKFMCKNTLHPNTCYDNLFPLTDSHQNTHDAQFLYNISVQVAMDEISRVHADFTIKETSPQTLENIDSSTYNLPLALDSCRNFLSLAMYNLNRSLPTSGSALATRETRTNFRTWLSGAGADLQTCKDDLEYAPAEVRRLVNSKLDKSTSLVSISLAIITKIDSLMSSSDENRRLRNPYLNDREPDWLSFEDSKRLYDSNVTIYHHAVVAADGSGNYRTITEAINAVPNFSQRRFVIYVKKGVYNENVIVNEKKWNVLMYGDGMRDTIVSSDLTRRTVATTSQTATFAARGQGFIAMYMGFRNTAGVASGPAVALLSGSDKSVFYRCKIEGYQDTLFVQKHRQFYRECKIYGTVDFIFGEAAVVIQKSDIIVRKSPFTITVITAQGKSDPNSISGITIQYCSIVGADDLGPEVRNFLGRPWQNYSTVVVMHSRLGSLIDPQGWSGWNDYTTIPNTALYVEHENEGPGADAGKRIRWKALVINDTAMASKYTVTSFLGGDRWIPASGVPFVADL